MEARRHWDHIFKRLKEKYCQLRILYPNRDFPGGTVVKNLPANAGDTGSIPDLGRSPMLWSN